MSKITIRDAIPSDLEAIIALDRLPNEDKTGYWQSIFQHYVVAGRPDRVFLVAQEGKSLLGFIIGEVRAWEFGSPPCGWVFALRVSHTTREGGIGTRMFTEICERLKKAGVDTVRTMVDIDNKLTLSFFRGMGLRTGRYVELEKRID